MLVYQRVLKFVGEKIIEVNGKIVEVLLGFFSGGYCKFSDFDLETAFLMSTLPTFY
jgi:hypothetical protein